MIKHECERKWVTQFHDDDKLEEGAPAYGPAVSSIIRVDDKWYAYNDEYATEIKYCPFCGQELK